MGKQSSEQESGNAIMTETAEYQDALLYRETWMGIKVMLSQFQYSCLHYDVRYKKKKKKKSLETPVLSN